MKNNERKRKKEEEGRRNRIRWFDMMIIPINVSDTADEWFSQHIHHREREREKKKRETKMRKKNGKMKRENVVINFFVSS